jgi:hypothetical protein
MRRSIELGDGREPGGHAREVSMFAMLEDRPRPASVDRRGFLGGLLGVAVAFVGEFAGASVSGRSGQHSPQRTDGGRKVMPQWYSAEPGWSLLMFLMTVLGQYKARNGVYGLLPDVWEDPARLYTYEGLTASSFTEFFPPGKVGARSHVYEPLPGWVAVVELSDDRKDLRLMVADWRQPSATSRYAVWASEVGGLTAPGREGTCSGLDIASCRGTLIEDRLRKR